MGWRGSHEISRCSWPLIATQERSVQFPWDAALDRISMLQCMLLYTSTYWWYKMHSVSLQKKNSITKWEGKVVDCGYGVGE